MISHEHRCIFVHVPKCAGQSIESAFLKDVGLNWKTRAVLLLQPNDHPEIGPPRLAHLLARDYVFYHYLSQSLFDDYFKFSVVRNPWSRVVSFYRYLNLNESFHDFVHRRLEASFAAGPLDSNFWFFRPQIDYVTNEDGRIIVDEILRLENLSAEFESVAARVGLMQPLGHANKSDSAPGRFGSILPAVERHRHLGWIRRRLASVRRGVGALNSRSTGARWRDFYDNQTRDKVRFLYARDVDEFNYTFEEG